MRAQGYIQGLELKPGLAKLLRGRVSKALIPFPVPVNIVKQ